MATYPISAASSTHAFAYWPDSSSVRSFSPLGDSGYFFFWNSRRAASSMGGGVIRTTCTGCAADPTAWMCRTMSRRFATYSDNGTCCLLLYSTFVASFAPRNTVTNSGGDLVGGNTSFRVYIAQRVL